MLFIKNGEKTVPVIKDAAYTYDPQTSKAKQNRGRIFELIEFNKDGNSKIYWLDTRRHGKIDLSKALLYDHLPNKEDIIEIGLVKIPIECWKCKKGTFVIAGTVLKAKEHQEFFRFPFLMEYLFDKTAYKNYIKENKIGTIKNRYNRTLHENYISNGCFYCDALQGEYFIKEELLEYQIHDQIPDPTYIENIRYDELLEFVNEPIVFKTR